MSSIISRSSWKARKPSGNVYETTWSNRTGFVVHHSGADDDQTVKEIQNFHMDNNGWADIGYNFLIDKYGKIYEGRGWLKIGAHVANHNTANIGVCIIGNYTNGMPTLAAMESLKWLYAEANELKGSRLKVYGHRQLGHTQCPGERLFSEVFDWLKNVPSKPSKPSMPTDEWTENLVNNLPELSKNDTGVAVERAQALLNVAGASLKEDGDFGPKTQSATKEYQRSEGLDDDGIIGPKTWTRLIGG